MTEWNLALSSVAGTSHTKNGRGCEDSTTYRQTDEFLLLCAADGAGTASHSAEGSRIACDLFISYFGSLSPPVHFLGKSPGKSDASAKINELAQKWLAELQAHLRIHAELHGYPIRELSATFLGAIIGPKGATVMQIGDGAIVSHNGKEFVPLTWPEQGEYANSTHFVVDEDAQAHLRVKQLDRRIEEIALFTDGLQRLALNFTTKEAHSPFFELMFAPLRGQSGGFSETVSQELTKFLDSPLVNERTDDDKSLVLATRRKTPSATV